MYKMINSQSQNKPGFGLSRTSLYVALTATTLPSSGAYAFEIDAENEDIGVRWDNTIKYNLAFGVQDISKQVVSRPGALTVLGDDADLGWEKEDVINNRLDILSELDVVWKENFGFRISGADWNDHTYSDGSNHPGFNEYLVPGLYADTWGSLSVPPGKFNKSTLDRYYKDFELPDAFGGNC